MKNLNEKEVCQVSGGICDRPPRDWDQLYSTIEDWQKDCLERAEKERARLEAFWTGNMGDSDSGVGFGESDSSCGGDGDGCGGGE